MYRINPLTWTLHPTKAGERWEANSTFGGFYVCRQANGSCWWGCYFDDEDSHSCESVDAGDTNTDLNS